ncbi:NADPH dehydrogenase NamA [Pedobacter yulinensis]|uniref:NADPH dehydrogenase NamA n=1 Tax=Pedobacter yulinensis TaxID=2126353 RepID=A0A2T3HQZ4_9SPHI|nr:NADPH dehydrogenase NamA [Pedobacter yulinensis]PST84849.1 NADPH dehydrogenase NamA [Pedobacter yulinensis]
MEPGRTNNVQLFSPFTLRALTFKNRMVMSPMCQYSAVDGFANNWHLVHLGSRAVGGAALIMQEATAVSPEGRISAGDLGIWKDEHIEKFREICTFINDQGSVAGIQLAHAGRKASFMPPWEGDEQVMSGPGSWQTVAPSPLPFKPQHKTPVELDDQEIARITTDFVRAAERALAAGFRVIEIHAAHGYLVHQFLSPLSNLRKDAYGGSFENRTRFLLQIVHAVRQVWPEGLPLFVRISATDWTTGGWDLEQSVELAKLLRETGTDLVDVSSGGNVPDAVIPAGPGYQVDFAAAVRQQSGMATGAVGIITSAGQAEEILVSGRADLVFMGREMLRNPYFPLHAAKELGVETPWPDQYLRAKR